ncbi:Uncharacterised protein [Actinobacillus lignieresii]|uniref:hypothetical protein n=1 Tax=Actinobacillus lignieresii TaxID=720 RepID=UPI000E1B35B8|nr:hypothetical protein [Actinobacillus lignieresii]SUT99356.1 Uncharacterised protein [Actinobacillus lignieresii]
MDKFNKKRIFDGFPIFFILVICFIYSTGQFTDTYIRHDDWEFMTHLLPNMNHHGTPWDKTLWEGRWINFLWSYQAKELSINANYIIFILGYSLFSWVYSSFLVKEYVYIKNDIFIIVSNLLFFMLNFNYLGKLYYVIPLFFIFYGANSWNEFYTSESKFAKIENNLLNLLSLQPRKDVFICGDIGKLVGTGVTRDINAISLSFLKRQNIVLHSEEVAECNYVPNHLGVYDVNGITILKLN